MQKVQMPDDVLSRFGEPRDEVQVCDEAGRVRGYFVSENFRALAYEWAMSQADDDEIKQARAESGGLTTAEAIAYLRQREADYRSRK